MRIFGRGEAPSPAAAPQTYDPYSPTAGWRPASPDSRLIDPRLLDSRNNAGLDSILAKRFPMINSVLLIRHGYVLYERYLGDGYAGKLNEIYGITQPVVAALIGIALQQGLLQSLDEKLIDLLPEDYNRNAQPQALQITIRHLLAMTSGFAWDPRQQEMVFYRVHNVHNILNGPMAHDAGTVFAYDDANVQLLSHVLTALTGAPASHFAAPAPVPTAGHCDLHVDAG